MRGRNPSAVQIRDRGAGRMRPASSDVRCRDRPKALNPGGMGAAPPSGSISSALFAFQRRHAIGPQDLEPVQRFTPALYEAPFL